MDPLSELFRKYGSDKGGEHLKAGDTCHNYGQAYHELFKDKRDQVRNVLEIGIMYGRSLRAWRDYFPNAEVIGIDINRSCLFVEPNIRCFYADQFNPNDLESVMRELGFRTFDLIVDDGSHEQEHQISAACTLLPYLADDGIYVIEDIHFDCHPERYGDPVVADQPDFTWSAVPTGHGIGRAHCECGCGEGEQLVVFRRAPAQ